MSRKKKKAEEKQREVRREPDVTYAPMEGGYPFPVAPAAQFVQLPPIVQPIVMVPFSSQQQPVATFVDDDDYDDDDDFDF